MDHPDYLELLWQEVALFGDRHGNAVLVSPGELERAEMADRVYLVLAPRLGERELSARLADDQVGDLPLSGLLLRVAWCSLAEHEGKLALVPAGYGPPVTVLTLAGLVQLDEICRPD